MAIVDERGRLLGRLNLLDAILLVLLVGLVPLGYAAYLLFREQPPRLVSVSPASLEQAPDLMVTVTGENLRPYMRISAGAQQAAEFFFRGPTEAEVPLKGLPAGTYDIVLYDQSQERARLPNALTIRPSAMPATELIAVGAFGNLDAAGAAKITAGLDLPGAGKVVAVGKPVPDLTQVFSSGLVGVPIPDALRLPAVVQFNCYIRTDQGRPFCVVGDASIAPPNLLMVSTPLGKTPFQVQQVRSPHPVESVPVRLRLTGQAAVLSLVRPGDVDLGGTSNELAAIARVASVGPVRSLSANAAEVDVNLVAQLQRVDGGWLYNSAPLRAGSTVVLRTARYEAGGVVTDLPSPERRGSDGQ
jgi:hypothetical protein